MVSFGDVVLIKFPFSSGLESKKRPAFIIRDTHDGDVILCRITSKIYNSKYDYFIERWVGLGLKLPSVIRLHKIATVEYSMIEKVMGTFSDIEKNEIEKILSNVFNCEISE